MRLLVCGSRHWDDEDTIYRVLDDLTAGHVDVVVIEGEAPGADTMARSWAAGRGVPFDPYPADWDGARARGDYRKAGPERNQRMLDEGHPTLVVAFPLGDSRGTWDMVRRAQRAGVPVRIYDHRSHQTYEAKA